MLNKWKVNYSLYLVTESSGRDIDSFCTVVEQALHGGVTLVQLREKTATSREFYLRALRIKELTDRYRVPLLINDRLDIALAVDAAGLHIGQEDLPVAVARKLLGPENIGCDGGDGGGCPGGANGRSGLSGQRRRVRDSHETGQGDSAVTGTDTDPTGGSNSCCRHWRHHGH